MAFDTNINNLATRIAQEVNLLRLELTPIVFTQSAIVTSPNAAANSKVVALSQSIAIPIDGDYLMSLSFNWNGNTSASDTVVYATFNGAAIDLNDRSGSAEGVNQIMRTETKDPQAGPAGDITGTSTGQKHAYSAQFAFAGLTTGSYPLVIEIGGEAAGISTSIWNIVAKFEKASVLVGSSSLRAGLPMDIPVTISLWDRFKNIFR